MKRIEEHFNEQANIHDDNFINRMGMKEFYDEVENQINVCNFKRNILVLGCGTGLEIERIKHVSNVTAIDISTEMINVLLKRELDKAVNLTTICASVLDYDFGKENYDIVLSCYTLHHFNVQQKQNIYRKIFACLNSKGVFINGDSIAIDDNEENDRLKSAIDIYNNEKMPFGSLHIDVPFTYQRESLLLKNEGFSEVVLLKEWTRSKLYKAIKL